MDKCAKCGKDTFLFGYQKMCYSCQKMENLRLTQGAIQAGDEDSIYYDTSSNDYIICPYCGNAFEPEMGDYTDGETVECDECGREFYLDVDYSVTYTTSKLKEAEE